jgi:pimeloyl-ACP methyl ester carboxylesterase
MYQGMRAPNQLVQMSDRSSTWRPRPLFAPATRVAAELGALRGLLGAGARGALRDYAPGLTGAPVLLVPGFLAGDRSLQPLAQRLAGAGYRPMPAGMDRNIDCSETATARLSDRLEEIVADHGGAVPVVGHSRGGMLAQVLARRRPELVSAVVTIAAPRREPLAMHPALLASALSLAAAGSAGVRGVIRYSCAFGRCCEAFREDLAAPIATSMPHLGVYSRRDGLVDWRACLDPAQGNVEVNSTHCGMAGDRVTGHVVAGFLATARCPPRPAALN